MVPVAVACACWSHRWSGKKILLHCDNSPVVEAWKAGSCWHPGAVCLIRKSLHIAALNNFTVLTIHIPGINNSIADALSRGQLARFRSLAPAADRSPPPSPSPSGALLNYGHAVLTFLCSIQNVSITWLAQLSLICLLFFAFFAYSVC